MKLTTEERDVIDEGLNYLEERDFGEAAQMLRRLVKDECPTFLPDWTTSPGDSLKELIECLEMPLVDFAAKAGLSIEAVCLLLEGRLTIDESLAERLGKIRASKAFWLERERLYRRDLARLDPAYVPQEVAAECLSMLQKALNGPPEGQPNTLWGMTRAVCIMHLRMEPALTNLLQHIERGDIRIADCGPDGTAKSFMVGLSESFTKADSSE